MSRGERPQAPEAGPERSASAPWVGASAPEDAASRRPHARPPARRHDRAVWVPGAGRPARLSREEPPRGRPDHRAGRPSPARQDRDPGRGRADHLPLSHPALHRPHGQLRPSPTPCGARRPPARRRAGPLLTAAHPPACTRPPRASPGVLRRRGVTHPHRPLPALPHVHLPGGSVLQSRVGRPAVGHPPRVDRHPHGPPTRRHAAPPLTAACPRRSATCWGQCPGVVCRASDLARTRFDPEMETLSRGGTARAC